jgi:hypothetical protein
MMSVEEHLVGQSAPTRPRVLVVDEAAGASCWHLQTKNQKATSSE